MQTLVEPAVAGLNGTVAARLSGYEMKLPARKPNRGLTSINRP